jgi:hypothetical protein
MCEPLVILAFLLGLAERTIGPVDLDAFGGISRIIITDSGSAFAQKKFIGELYDFCHLIKAVQSNPEMIAA